jgi:tellurite methyltransferase
MTELDWSNFATLTRENAHWPLTERAAALVGRAGYALDLGAGAGRDTRYLLAQGWHVTALDGEPAAIAILSDIRDEKLTVVQGSIQDFAFEPEKYDLVSAQFSLPFVPRAKFAGVFARIKAALKPGGLFAGQFFGLRDEWNTPGSGGERRTEITFLPRDKVDDLLRDMEVIEFAEEDKMGDTATGAMKHWHVFHVIAQKGGAG